MKLEARQNTLSTNSSGDEVFPFYIEENEIIIEILREHLYSFPIQTVTREYLANARDAHRLLGKEHVPVQISVPTELESVFSVRDFGPGLSTEEVAKVFCSFGKSTKRQSSHYTGGFGIGSKSAFAYTDSFTITSFQNGVKTSYLAHLGNSRSGEVVVVGREPTGEENGLQISIVVNAKDKNEFINCIKQNTFFWDTAPVWTDKAMEALPNHRTFKYPLATSELKVIKKEEVPFSLPTSRKDWLVVDGFIYPNISNEFYGSGYHRSYDYFAFLIVRSNNIHYSATRESIKNNEHNKNIINNELEENNKKYFNELVKFLENAPTPKKLKRINMDDRTSLVSMMKIDKQKHFKYKITKEGFEWWVNSYGNIYIDDYSIHYNGKLCSESWSYFWERRHYVFICCDIDFQRKKAANSNYRDRENIERELNLKYRPLIKENQHFEIIDSERMSTLKSVRKLMDLELKVWNEGKLESI